MTGTLPFAGRDRELKKRSAIRLPAACRADAFDDVLGLLRLEACGKRHLRNVNIGQTVRAMADAAAQMHVSLTVTRVIEVAHAVLLRARTVVDFVQKVRIGEKGKHAEERGTVHGGQLGLQVSQVEGVTESVTHLFPDEQTDSRHADARVDQCLFVVDFDMHECRTVC